MLNEGSSTMYRTRVLAIARCALIALLIGIQLAPMSGTGPAPAYARSASTTRRVALGVYRPSLPDDLSGLAGYEQAMQHPMSIVHWYSLWGGWKSAFSRDDLESVNAHGSLPMVTWEPWAGAAAD